MTSSAEDMLSTMKPIAVDLDIPQRSSYTLPEVEGSWKDLGKNLRSFPVDAEMHSCFGQRYEQALTPAHVLSVMVDSLRVDGAQVTENERNLAITFAVDSGKAFLPTLVRLQARSLPLIPTLFNEEVLRSIKLIDWRKCQINALGKSTAFLEVTTQLLARVASMAGIKRMFSLFGLEHSKLRNKFGVQKAGKLVFFYKLLNENCYEALLSHRE